MNPVATPSQTTTYLVEVVSSFFSTTGEVTVHVDNIPETPVVTAQGETLYSSAQAGNQWYDLNGPVAGATGQSYTPTRTDFYYTVVSNENGCQSAPSNQVYMGFTGLGKSEGAANMTAFPNPFRDDVNITYALLADADVKLVIYNTIGKEVAVADQGRRSLGMHSVSFDGSGLTQGVYYCKLFSGDEVRIVKIIRNR
jgi:hypothetical protein